MDNKIIVTGSLAIERAYGNMCLITGKDPYCDNTVDVLFLSGKWKGVRVPFPLSSLRLLKKNKFFKKIYDLK